MRPTMLHTASAARARGRPALALISAEPGCTDTGTIVTPTLASAEAAPEPLNLAERLAAQLGAWVGALAERWAPGCGPFFAADGQIAVASTLFAPERVHDAPHTAE